MYTDKQARRQQNLLFIIVILFWFAQDVYIPQQTPYLTLAGLSAGYVGIVVGTYGISQMLLRLPIGVMADMVGRHKGFICIGVLSSGLASCFRIFLTPASGFLIANLLSGLASAMWISYIVFYTNFSPAELQQKATSRIILACNIGILSSYLVSTLCYQSMGMKFLCKLSVLSGLMGLVLAVTGIRDPKRNENQPQLSSAGSFLRICKNHRLIIFSLLAVIQQGIQMSTSMSFTNQVLEDMGALPSVIGLACVIYMGASVLSAWFGGSALCRKFGPRLWIPVVFSLLALYCILIPTAPGITFILFCQILPGFSSGVLYSYLTSEAMVEVPKEQKSTAMGFFQAVYALGITFFPILAGNIAQHSSMKAAYFVLAGFAAVGCLSSIFYYRLQKQSR